MRYKWIIIRDEIEEELALIDQLQETLIEVNKQKPNAEIRRRVYASILEDFYMAVEKSLKSIAIDIDNNVPDGGSWHKKLLRQMSIKIPEVRPAVIDKKLFHKLEDYLKFRHLVHNIYGFQLEYERFKHLINELDGVIKDLNNQLTDFFEQMDRIVNDDLKE